jgi:hypothetical protein
MAEAERECSYTENSRRCHEPAVGALPSSWAHPELPVCERHIQPAMHPPDLHGRFVRWKAA